MQAGCYDRIVLITIFDDNRPRVNKISSAGMPVFTKLGHPLLFMFNMTEFIPNIDVLFFYLLSKSLQVLVLINRV